MDDHDLQTGEISEVLSILKELKQRDFDIFRESEKRIDNVNQMISDLITLMKDLTEKYVKHLEQVCCNRNQVTEQNIKLLELVKAQEEQLSKERQRYDELLQQLIRIAQSQKANTQVNVK